MTYKVVLTHNEEGYSVGCPELPGCWSEGQTEEEAISNIREAIQEYLSVQPKDEIPWTVHFVEIPEMPARETAAREPFEVKPWAMGLPKEWTSHKVEDLLDMLEGPNRR